MPQSVGKVLFWRVWHAKPLHPGLPHDKPLPLLGIPKGGTGLARQAPTWFALCQGLESGAEEEGGCGSMKKKRGFCKPLVGRVGVEPTQYLYRRILSPLRLPIPPPPRVCSILPSSRRF